MILAVDVHYHDGGAVIAGVAFQNWHDESAISTYITTLDRVHDYVSGSFYRREMPCILRLLDEYGLSPDCILIDGYVYLDGTKRPGLGSHLYEALQHKIEVIGVAKKPLSGMADDYAVYRGGSRRPLYVTCAGVPLDTAKKRVLAMSGAHRLPTLLKRVDRLCRGGS